MRNMRRLAAIGVLSVVMVAGFGTTPGMAQSRAHVYLLRGLMNIFSLGMDTLAEKNSAPRHLRDGPQLFGVADARRPRCGRLSRRHRGADHHHRAFARRRRRHGDVRLPRQERRSSGARGSVRRYTILCYAEQCRPRAQPDPCRLRPRVSRGRLPRLDIQRRREQRSQHRPSQHRQIGAAARPSDRRHSRGRGQRQRKSEAGARGE